LQQLLSVWSALNPRRRIIVVLATLAVFAAVLALSRMAATPSMSLLYAGLDSGPAGEVVQALEQRGVTYDVRGGSIFVDASKRDELRMTLASQGLPTNSMSGYELLDSLSGFGTTSQMFDAAYWRAKEGELARTILSSPGIRAARVYIANPSSRPFRRELKTTASVTVTTAAGSLSSRQAKALKYLVASAVAGLLPEDVAIIDAKGGLIQGGDDAPSGTSGAGDRASVLRANVQRLLEARVGAGNAVVEVSVETVTARETISERRLDPESRVAISSDTQDQSTASKDSGGGASSVTVASNLPAGNAASGGRNSSSQNSDTRERINYEVSETKREVLRAPGAIKRLTVAVLVNGNRSVDSSGEEVFTPRSDAELASLRELVASAVGFQKDRGDVITMKSLKFSPVPQEGTAATVSFMDSLNLDVLSLIQLIVLALVALALGMFVVRPIMKNAPVTAALPRPNAAALGQSDLPTRATQGGGGESTSLTGEISDGDFLAPSMAVVSDFDVPEGGAGDGLEALPALSSDPVTRLRQMIEDRQEETVEVLRGWMQESGESV